MPLSIDQARPPLSVEALGSEISRYTYRAGWVLTVFLDKYEGPCLYIQAEVADGYDSSKTTPLRIRSNIPPMHTREQFKEWVQWRLIQIEIHESREFLRYDGELVSDPHNPIEPLSPEQVAEIEKPKESDSKKSDSQSPFDPRVSNYSSFRDRYSSLHVDY